MKFVLRTSEVKFALNFAVRRNFTHEVNFTIEDNFTCPKGKLSFSVFSVKDNTLRGVELIIFCSNDDFRALDIYAIRVEKIVYSIDNGY